MKQKEQYLGIHMEKLRSEKERRKHFIHPIFLYTPDKTVKDTDFKRLNQIVNIYEHSMEDFEFNSLRIIDHYRKYYGDTDLGMFTLGQSITFRVYKGQEPISLSLFKFFLNYTQLILPITLEVDMHDWTPAFLNSWSNDLWIERMDQYIEQARPHGNMRKICECLSMSKHLCNTWAARAGDRIGLSISNNDFLEVMKRSKEAKETITCSYPIPKDITPSELEKLASRKAKNLLDTISRQKDLPISVYTRNGLFNAKQFQEFAAHITFKPDLYGSTIPFTSNTNIFMGLNDPRAFVVDAYGGRKAEVIKLNVSDAGALERSLCMLMSPVRFVDTEYECDSRHFRKKKVTNVSDLKRLDGRVCTLDPKSDEYWIIDPKEDKFLGKTIYLKSPVTCTHPRRSEGYICSACYGKLLANLNVDIHVGRLVALNCSDDIEQKLLSAKHALKTDTNDIVFPEIFTTFFDHSSSAIYFNDDMIALSAEEPDEFSRYSFEFHLSDMKKEQDGEGRQYDRSFSEIVIYDSKENTRITIQELNGARIYLEPEFNNEFFLEHFNHAEKKGIIRVPFDDIVDNGKVICDLLFEYKFQNNEMAAPLLRLEKILNSNAAIGQFTTYDDCLDVISPLFIKGGIDLYDYQSEMIISQMVYGIDDKPVDWTQEHPQYKIVSLNTAIDNSPCVLTSVLHQETSRKLSGMYNTYEKQGTSAYDWFIWTDESEGYQPAADAVDHNI